MIIRCKANVSQQQEGRYSEFTIGRNRRDPLVVKIFLAFNEAEMKFFFSRVVRKTEPANVKQKQINRHIIPLVNKNSALLQ